MCFCFYYYYFAFIFVEICILHMKFQLAYKSIIFQLVIEMSWKQHRFFLMCCCQMMMHSLLQRQKLFKLQNMVLLPGVEQKTPDKYDFLQNRIKSVSRSDWIDILMQVLFSVSWIWLWIHVEMFVTLSFETLHIH